MDKLKLVRKIPDVDEFINMRKSVGWTSGAMKDIENSLNNSMYSICAEYDGKFVGYGRIIGDGGMYYYIQDVIVLPEYQRKGIGEKIISELINYIKTNCPIDSFVGLMSSKGKEGFYKKYGFIERPNDSFGAGMFIRVSKD